MLNNINVASNDITSQSGCAGDCQMLAMGNCDGRDTVGDQSRGLHSALSRKSLNGQDIGRQVCGVAASLRYIVNGRRTRYGAAGRLEVEVGVIWIPSFSFSPSPCFVPFCMRASTALGKHKDRMT